MKKIIRLMTTEELDKYLSLAETPSKQKKYLESLQKELLEEYDARSK